jgi:hypothetical protein
MPTPIEDFLRRESIEPYPDQYYGDGFRCSATLKDGTHLPCVMVRRNAAIIELATRRFEEEKRGKGVFGGRKDAYREIVKNFVASGNCVNAYDIETAAVSPYGIPLTLLRQIQGETLMSWTGFVFEMKDGSRHSFGTTFLTAFFELPNGYTFDDVLTVHNHSFVDESGQVVPIRQPDGSSLAPYRRGRVYRERPYFDCFID